MKPMYPGIPFSPATTLAVSIGAADTTITVADSSVLPDGPNYATIGADETGEVIYYAAKADNILSGCVRGIEGTAQQWNAGTVVGRNWNNVDYQNLIDNIKDLDNTKIARADGFTAGNIAMLDENGNLKDSGLPAASLIDKTLSVSGRAADAKTTGEAISKVLPSVTTVDAGKFLRVSSAGKWIAETVPNAEEASF